MSVISKKKEEISDIKTAKFVTSALRDISANRIEELRNRFETNLSFYNEMGELYVLVKGEAFRRMRMGNKKKENLFPDQSSKEGSLSVAVTSNSHFYGALNRDIMDEFVKYSKKNPERENLIIGKTGVQYIKEKKIDLKFNEIFFKGESPTSSELKKFLDGISKYKNVNVFYPKFINVFEQKVDIRDISYMPKEVETKRGEDITRYTSEPVFPQILDFFETQVKYILIRRTMLESDLSRTAARLMKMDEAESEAIESISKSEKDLQSAINRMQNIRLLETFSGFKKWN